MFVPVVIVGAGHAGLAMSRRLTERSIDHVVLERGEVANSWRTERWESLRLLTPNWHVRLPGHRDDGYMTVREVANHIAGYARTITAPVHAGTTVTGVTAGGDGCQITTDRGLWRCTAMVIATGACSVAVVPPIAAGLPDRVASVTPQTYRRANDLEDGGVLIVGASATGVQLAEEIHRSGRPVTLAVEYLGAVADPSGNDRAIFSASTTINREDWGLTWNLPLAAGGLLVTKEIRIEIEAELVRQPS